MIHGKQTLLVDVFVTQFEWRKQFSWLLYQNVGWKSLVAPQLQGTDWEFEKEMCFLSFLWSMRQTRKCKYLKQQSTTWGSRGWGYVRLSVGEDLPLKQSHLSHFICGRRSGNPK